LGCKACLERPGKVLGNIAGGERHQFQKENGWIELNEDGNDWEYFPQISMRFGQTNPKHAVPQELF